MSLPGHGGRPGSDGSRPGSRETQSPPGRDSSLSGQGKPGPANPVGPRFDLSMRVRVLGPAVMALGALALLVLVGLPWRLHAVAEEWSERRVASLAVVAAESVKSGLDFGDT